MPKILVTGGAGYIGSHTTHLLTRRGFDVVVVDNLSRGFAHNVAPGQLRQISLQETDRLTTLLRDEKIEAVIHFAAYISVGESTAKPELYFTNNTAGSISLLDAMLAADVKRIVFSSTAAVYGNPLQVPIPETHPYAPVNPYGESKVMVEKMLQWLSQYRGLQAIALRYFNACGAEPDGELGEEHDPETHLIPLLLRAVQTGQPMTLFGDDYPTPDGTCIRDYVHVSDLADAHLAALDQLDDRSVTYNLGNGAGYSVLEVLQAVERVSGRKVPMRHGPRRPGDPARLVASSDRIRQDTGWTPNFAGLDDIVRTAWEWRVRHPDGYGDRVKARAAE